MIFRSFIMKDWFGVDKNYRIHYKYNKKIVKFFIQHYWKYWSGRNNMRSKPEIRRKYVLEWHKRKIVSAKIHGSVDVRKYVRECELKPEDRSIDYMQRWFLGLNIVVK